MRLFVILACLAVVVVAALVWLVWEGPSPQTANHTAPTSTVTNRQAPAARPIQQPPAPVGLQPTEAPHDQELTRVNEKTVKTFGKEFEQRWYQDRERLGVDRHREMENLWFEGRRPRGEPNAIDKLEKLLADFSDTNRAGCAAYELGHHYLKNRQKNEQERKAQAEKYWRMVDERYRDSLCEYNAPADALSKLALVTWIYRSTDQPLARRLLQELATQHPGETDHLGQPIEQTAKRLLTELGQP